MTRRFAASPIAWSAMCAAITLSCSRRVEELPAFGEVLIEMDTDLAVPKSVNRVRVDLFSTNLDWIESRDFATPDADDFPLSFSVYNDSFATTREALVRIRAYPEGRIRDYRGERFEPRPTFQEPTVSGSLVDACRTAPPLTLGEPQTLRLRAAPFADGSASCNGRANRSGLAAFKLEIAEANEYRVEVVSAEPGFEWFFAADTVMSVRTSCEMATSELSCNDDVAQFGVLSGLTQRFDPGTYYLVVGNAQPGPMDVTLLANRADRFFDEAPAEPPAPPSDDAPRLVVDGVDVTPPKEPSPWLAVDRIVYVRVEPEKQSTVKVLLTGECVGTMADLAGRRTCIDTENALVPVEPATLLEGRKRLTTRAVGSWQRYTELPCSGEPKGGTSASGVELFDERVCIEGGSFVLGDPSVLGRQETRGSRSASR